MPGSAHRPAPTPCPRNPSLSGNSSVPRNSGSTAGRCSSGGTNWSTLRRSRPALSAASPDSCRWPRLYTGCPPPRWSAAPVLNTGLVLTPVSVLPMAERLPTAYKHRPRQGPPTFVLHSFRYLLAPAPKLLSNEIWQPLEAPTNRTCSSRRKLFLYWKPPNYMSSPSLFASRLPKRLVANRVHSLIPGRPSPVHLRGCRSRSAFVGVR